MNRIQIFCKVNNGKISTTSSDEIKQFIQANEGKNLEITLQRRRSKRTDLQNKYYWGAIIPIIQNAFKDLGYRITKDETHDLLREKFLAVDATDQLSGEVLAKLKKSTSSLSKSEFIEYIDQITEWSATILGIPVPPPESQTQLEYN